MTITLTEAVRLVGLISGGFTYNTEDSFDGIREYVSAFHLFYTLDPNAGNEEFTQYSAIGEVCDYKSKFFTVSTVFVDNLFVCLEN